MTGSELLVVRSVGLRAFIQVWLDRYAMTVIKAFKRTLCLACTRTRTLLFHFGMTRFEG